MSVTDAWIEHADALTLDVSDRDVDLGIVPGRFDCYTDDDAQWSQPRDVTLEEALAWFESIGMPPRLKLSAVDLGRVRVIENAKDGKIAVWLRCESCERTTVTGLCGCEDPAPYQIGAFSWNVSATDG